MNSERIKEILEATAYPESRSVHLALKQVWNECEQDKKIYVTFHCGMYHTDVIKTGIRIEPTNRLCELWHGSILWFKKDEIELSSIKVDDDKETFEKKRIVKRIIAVAKVSYDLLIEKKANISGMSIIKIE